MIDLKMIICLNEVAAQYVRMGKQIDSLQALIDSGTAVYVNFLPQPGTKNLGTCLDVLNNRPIDAYGPIFTQGDAIIGTAVIMTMIDTIKIEREKLERVLTGANYQLKDIEAQIKAMSTYLNMKGEC
jgi:ABC-type amino acid transport system permease subunit